MEELIKVQRSKHDAHDLLLGILYYFPEEAKWDELGFHETLSKIALKYRILDNFAFNDLHGLPYCPDFGKVFDLLELSGLLKRNEDYIKLFIDIIRGHFDEEIKPTFEDKDLDMLKELSLDLQKALGIA